MWNHGAKDSMQLQLGLPATINKALSGSVFSSGVGKALPFTLLVMRANVYEPSLIACRK
jgi:hypothetical protein